jgi:hypothetical protein
MPARLNDHRLFFLRAHRQNLGMTTEEHVLAIAHNRQLSADERMRRICAIDKKYLGWTSPQWAALLGVSANAIRLTPFWKYGRT